MTLWLWPDSRAVLELGDGETALELVLYLDAEGTRAAWVLSQPGRLLGWAAVGLA